MFQDRSFTPSERPSDDGAGLPTLAARLQWRARHQPDQCGYHQRPDLTAERFVPHPFAHIGLAQSGARLCRTGDLPRYLPDGRIAFLGRIDHQIKICGFRVEPAEIAAVLREHPAIKEAVVVARKDPTGDTRIVAYVIQNKEQRNKEQENNREAENPEPRTQNLEDSSEVGSKFLVLGSALREFLAQRLPAYMLPSAFVLLDALPLMPSGKRDRGSLPAPEQDRSQLQAAFVPARTSTEILIAGIWREVFADRYDRYPRSFL